MTFNWSTRRLRTLYVAGDSKGDTHAMTHMHLAVYMVCVCATWRSLADQPPTSAPASISSITTTGHQAGHVCVKAWEPGCAHGAAPGPARQGL